MTNRQYIPLSEDWLTEGLIDLEFKKYKLLSYLQSVDSKFSQRSLYPPFSDIIFHNKNLLKFKENTNTFIRDLPKSISSVNLEKLMLQYEHKFEDPEFMEDLQRIVEFAEPIFTNKIKEGKEIYDQIEQQIKFEPIGLCPINQSEGYLLINNAFDSDVHVFEYQVSIFKSADSKFRGIHTKFLKKMRKSISTTFESIKMGLIKQYKKTPKSSDLYC